MLLPENQSKSGTQASLLGHIGHRKSSYIPKVEHFSLMRLGEGLSSFSSHKNVGRVGRYSDSRLLVHGGPRNDYHFGVKYFASNLSCSPLFSCELLTLKHWLPTYLSHELSRKQHLQQFLVIQHVLSEHVSADNNHVRQYVNIISKDFVRAYDSRNAQPTTA